MGHIWTVFNNVLTLFAEEELKVIRGTLGLHVLLDDSRDLVDLLDEDLAEELLSDVAREL